jgi:decaprenylphospho-beta-D-erythro-pentofuranosid-2-ulose 2-reductase
MSAPEFNAVLIGATSAIATEAARAMVAEKPCRLLLIGRDPTKLEAVAQDLRVRGATVEIQSADFLDPATDWKGMLQNFAAGHALDCVLIAHGELSDQNACLTDGPAFARSIAVNFTSAAFIASVAAEILATQGHGTLGVIGSVAGDRGRQSIFLYGSAKAGLDTFLEGLRHFHAGKPGLKIVTIKPGLIDTPMTADVKKGPLCTSAEKAGQLVWKAMRTGKPVAYIPGWWRWILLVIRLVPRAIFYRTRL